MRAPTITSDREPIRPLGRVMMGDENLRFYTIRKGDETSVHIAAGSPKALDENEVNWRRSGWSVRHIYFEDALPLLRQYGSTALEQVSDADLRAMLDMASLPVTTEVARERKLDDADH